MSLQKQLPKPNLDDKTFAQLVDEALRLIPRYAPDWTDHNPSDPGITLTELFAWLTETSLYRLNLITDTHRLKYLKLLGWRPLPAVAAWVEFTFEADQKTTLNKDTPVCTRISGRDICFELAEEIIIVPVRLNRIIVDELAGGVFDRTSMNGKADLFYAAFGLEVRKGCALYLGFDRPSDTVSFLCSLYEEDLIAPGRHGGEPDYDFENSKLRWEISAAGNSWTRVVPVKDGTKGFKKSGKILFNGLQDWVSAKTPVSDESYWLRCVVEESYFEYPPRIGSIVLNTVPAIQGNTIQNESEWKGTGLPGQTFSLKQLPVIDKSLELSVDGVGAEERDDLDGSGPSDNHFVLEREKGEIRFGDGLLGRVPPAGVPIKIIRYRICSGAAGNVPSGSEWRITEMGDIQIKNIRPASGGTDEESVENAAYRFVHDLRVPYTAVTSADFEYIAINTPGLRVAKAKAIPNHHPLVGNSPGTVTVVVIPFTPLEFFENPPRPSRGFIKAVCRHLNVHRLVGTEIYVTEPLYLKVTARTTVALSSGFQEEQVIVSIRDGLNRFLHPVKGGEGRDGWPIGRNVYRSEVYRLIEEIEGVECITKLFLSGDKGSKLDGKGNLILPSPTATVYSGRHEITILKEPEECRRKKKNAKD